MLAPLLNFFLNAIFLSLLFVLDFLTHSMYLLWNAIFFSYSSMSFGCSSFFPLRVYFSFSFFFCASHFYRVLTNNIKTTFPGEGEFFFFLQSIYWAACTVCPEKNKNKYYRVCCTNTDIQYIPWIKVSFFTTEISGWNLVQTASVVAFCIPQNLDISPKSDVV